MSRSHFIILAAFLAGVSGPVLGATISCRQDGTGDYVRLQTALDACVAGDTLLIGAGEYTEMIPSTIPGYSWLVDVCAFVPVPGLTIIGAGRDSTILGPLQYPEVHTEFSPKGLVCLDGAEIRVKGVTIRNSYEGIHLIGSPAYIEDCGFEGNAGAGVLWLNESGGGRVANCAFSSEHPFADGILLTGYGSGTIISDCQFENSSINLIGAKMVVVKDSSMVNAAVGVRFSFGATGLLDGCRIESPKIGLSLRPVDSSCEIVDCEISGAEAAVWGGGAGECSLSATRSILQGGSYATLYLDDCTTVNISEGHILRGAGPAIRCLRPAADGPVTYDMRGNYWGTTSADSIAAWIWDSQDDPTIFSTVDFEPFSSEPLPTEKQSLGGFRAMFR